MSSIKAEFAVEKLRGSENFHNWTFAIENLLQFKGLGNCLVLCNETQVAVETDPTKLIQAKSTLVLSVDPSLYVHIRNAKSAIEIWDIFHKMYEDNGVLGTVSLLLNFVSTKLESCDNMQVYLDKLTEYSNKMNRVGITVPDPLLAAFMLAGLTEEYRPFILGFQGNIGSLSTQIVKTRLLDCHSGLFSQPSNSAFLSNSEADNGRNKKKFVRQPVICHYCGRKGHRIEQCFKKQKAEEDEDSDTSSKKAFSCFVPDSSSNVWYLDSGASNHMTSHEDILFEKRKSNINEIITANNSKMKVHGVGKTNLFLNGEKIEVDKVLYVPDLSCNLLSVNQLLQKGNRVNFNKDFCSIYASDNTLITRCKSTDGVYKLRNESAKCLFSRAETTTAEISHHRFRHPNRKSFCRMRDGAVNGMIFSNDVIFHKSIPSPVSKITIQEESASGRVVSNKIHSEAKIQSAQDEIDQMNVATAFLHGDLEEEIYIEQSESCSMLDHMQNALNSSFNMKDLDAAKVCSNSSINKSKNEIETDRIAYIRKNSQLVNRENCNPVCKPSDPQYSIRRMKKSAKKRKSSQFIW